MKDQKERDGEERRNKGGRTIVANLSFFFLVSTRVAKGVKKEETKEREIVFLEKEEEGEENLVKIFLFYTFFLFFFVSRSISTRAPLRS